MNIKIILLLATLIFISSCELQAICDIGKEEIAGDFKVTPINTTVTTILLNRECAIKDCIAYNEHYNKSLCVV